GGRVQRHGAHRAVRHREPRARSDVPDRADAATARPLGRKGAGLAARLAPVQADGAAGRAAGGAAGGVGRMTSAMRETIWRQPADLRSLLADPDPVEREAERLAGKRIVTVGTEIGRA